LSEKAVILVSGRGSNMTSIIQSVKKKELSIDIIAVISDKINPEAFRKAEDFNIPVYYLGSKIREFEKRLKGFITENNIKFIILAGFMRILSEEFVGFFPQKIINIHPSYLPHFPGLNAQLQAWENGAEYTGVTVHYVDKGVDTGNIIYQERFRIDRTLDFETFKEKLLELEHEVYIKALKKITELKSGGDHV
jgi:phosphoribosylglycinamide formyltransferase-1